MVEYLIAFNDEWVPEFTLEELREKSRNLRPLIAEMTEAGALTFGPSIARSAPSSVCSRYRAETA